MLFAFHNADDHPIAQLKTVGPSAAVVLGLCIGAMLLSVKVLYSAPSRSDCHGAAFHRTRGERQGSMLVARQSWPRFLRSPHVERGGRACGFCCGNDDDPTRVLLPLHQQCFLPPPLLVPLSLARYTAARPFPTWKLSVPVLRLTTSEAGEVQIP